MIIIHGKEIELWAEQAEVAAAVTQAEGVPAEGIQAVVFLAEGALVADIQAVVFLAEVPDRAAAWADVPEADPVDREAPAGPADRQADRRQDGDSGAPLAMADTGTAADAADALRPSL